MDGRNGEAVQINTQGNQNSVLDREKYNVPFYIFRKPFNIKQHRCNIQYNKEEIELSSGDELELTKKKHQPTRKLTFKEKTPIITRLLKRIDKANHKKKKSRLEEAFFKTTKKFERAVDVERTDENEYKQILKGQNSLLTNLRSPYSFIHYKKRMLQQIILKTQTTPIKSAPSLKIKQCIQNNSRIAQNVSSVLPEIAAEKKPLVYFYKVEENYNDRTMKSLLEDYSSDSIKKVNHMIILSAIANSPKKDPFSDTFVTAYRTLDINPNGMCGRIKKEMSTVKARRNKTLSSIHRIL